MAVTTTPQHDDAAEPAVGPTSGPVPGEQLWMAGPDARRRMRRLPRRVRKHVRELADRGITIVRGAVRPEVAREVAVDLHRFIDEHRAEVEAPEHTSFRIDNLHLGSAAARQVAFDPQILAVLDAAMGYPVVAYSSLTFAVGTQQVTHRDGPYFATNPEGFFIAAWTALEDIHPDSGPLHYYPGGHKVHAERTDGVGTYGESVKAACEAAGIAQHVVDDLRIGDTVIWHPELPHGGTPIRDAARTRESIVVHYKAGNVPLHGPENFFGREPYRTGETATYRAEGDRHFVDHRWVTVSH